MLSQVLTIVLTALLSSALTVGLAWWLYQRRLKTELDAQLATAVEEVDGKLKEALQALGDIVEERVKRGVVTGVASLPSTEVLAGTTKSVAELASKGLSALFGIKPRKTEE